MGSHVEGRVIVITGAGGGFGRLVAQKCAALGGRVVASDVDEGGLKETIASTEGAKGEVIGVQADVTDLSSMRALAAQAVDAFGAIDVMVNNAGTMPLALYADHARGRRPPGTRCIDVNFKGVLHGIMAVYDQMIEQGRGTGRSTSRRSTATTRSPAPRSTARRRLRSTCCPIRSGRRPRVASRSRRSGRRACPATGLGEGDRQSRQALAGILGQERSQLHGDDGRGPGRAARRPSSHGSREHPVLHALDPELLADQIVYVIDQPWGVSIGDLTVRASGDTYVI